jgi:single-strand DNA-binding protein
VALQEINMASVNKVSLVGHLGRNPETRTFPSGDQVCNATLATTDRWKDKQSGEMREATEWHRLVFNGRLAEIAAQYLRKGSQIYVEGAIRTRKYTGRDGVEKYATDIRVDQMQMLSSRQATGGPAGRGDDDDSYGRDSGVGHGTRSEAAPRAPTGFDDMDDDIPF